MPNDQTIIQDSSPEQIDETVDPSSTEQQAQDTESGTPQQPESQEQEQAPLHEHPRFKEVIDEKNWYKQQLEQQLSKQQSQQVQPTQQPQQPVDPYAGMTPEQEQAARWIDQRIEARAKEIAQKEIGTIKPVVQQGYQEIINMKVGEFRRNFPDIQPGSSDEKQIAGLMRQGLSMNQAYWAHMGERGVQQKVQQIKQQNQRKLEQKRQANVGMQPSVPSSAQNKPKKSFEEELAEQIMGTENLIVE